MPDNTKIKLTVRVPHLNREYDVDLKKETSGKRLYEALIQKLGNLQQGGAGIVVFELFAKRAGKKIFPDLQEQTLEEMNIKPGETIILKKDMDPGVC